MSSAWRSASVASSQSSSVPTYLCGSFVDRLNVKSSKPNARSTDSTKSSSEAISSAACSGGAEDVAVVLGEAADAQQSVQRAGPLVAVHRAQLEQPQRQLAVAALARPEDQAVHRAVHRLHVVRAVVHLHRRVHAVGVPGEVADCLEQLAVGEVRREHELVAAVLVALPAVVLDQLAHDGALGVPDGEPAAELVREAEQVELGGELAVVALLGLGELVEVGLQRRVGLPRRAVDALQHRALLVAPPVGAGDLLQLEVAEAAGRRHVRALAQVDELGACCGTR